MEYQVGNKGIILDTCKPNESIYIFGCKDSVIQVQGKSSGLSFWITCTCSCGIFWEIGAPYRTGNFELKLAQHCILSLLLMKAIRCGSRFEVASEV